MATTNDIKLNKLQVTDNEERDGFVEYCKFRTCERMEADHAEGNWMRNPFLIFQLRLHSLGTKNTFT